MDNQHTICQNCLRWTAQTFDEDLPVAGRCDLFKTKTEADDTCPSFEISKQGHRLPLIVIDYKNDFGEAIFSRAEATKTTVVGPGWANFSFDPNGRLVSVRINNLHELLRKLL